MPRIFKGLLVGTMTGLVGMLLGLTPYGANFERNVGLNLLFKIRGQLPAPQEVAVVAINNRTGDQIDLPSLPRDWPRSIHGQLVDNLVQRGAAIIVFDIHFHQPETPDQDQLFVDSVVRADRVVLVEQVNGKRQPLFNANGKIVGAVWAEELLQPFAKLAHAAQGLGTFTLPKTEAAVHGFWVFKESMRDAPTLPALALHLYAMQNQTDNTGLNAKNLTGEIASIAAESGYVSQAERTSSDMKDLRLQYIQQGEAIGQQSSNSLAGINPALEKMYRGSTYRYLNFYGPPGTIKTVPYHAVINGSDPNVPDAHLDFSGKVVFVGYSDLFDPGQPDRFYTVYTSDDGVDLSGVEIAATAFANLLNDQTLTLPGGYQAPLILFGFGFLAGLVTYLLPALFGIPLVFIVFGLYFFIAQANFNNNALWLPLAIPVFVEMPMAIFLGLLGHYFFERRRRQHISDALTYYLPESAARQLTQKSADPDSFNKVVYSTCLATDMAGFSKIAEIMSPGDLALMLNDYFDTLATSLNKHGVDVTEFRADAIMCAWTAEQANVEMRKKPILAALEAAHAMEDFKERYEIFNTDLRVGLESGTIYIGHAGGGGHFVFSIVGDCANTASRIEGLNKHIGTRILATQTVIEGLDGLLLRYIGDFLFVNKTEASSIYEIVSTHDQAKAEQLSLLDHYAQALESFQQGLWEQAKNQFGAILEDYPDDGPSRFLLSRCTQYLGGSNIPEDPKVILMDAK